MSTVLVNCTALCDSTGRQASQTTDIGVVTDEVHPVPGAKELTQTSRLQTRALQTRPRHAPHLRSCASRTAEARGFLPWRCGSSSRRSQGAAGRGRATLSMNRCGAEHLKERCAQPGGM